MDQSLVLWRCYRRHQWTGRIRQRYVDIACLKPFYAVIQESSVYFYLNIFQPSKVASLGTGGVSLWPRGKLLGGSSILNYMLYVRGNSRQVDYTNQSINSFVSLILK